MTASEMPADQFWEIIERAAQLDDDPIAHINALRAELRKLPSEEIKSWWHFGAISTEHTLGIFGVPHT